VQFVGGESHDLARLYSEAFEIEQGGGSAQANARAAAVVWPVVLEYLAAMK
jgi:hypothetical protein